MRCEDFPCCGHQLGECPTGPAKECPECGRVFEPCSLGETYCLACGQRPRMKKFDMGPMPFLMPQPGDREPRAKTGKCSECETEGPLWWAIYGRRHENLCQDCADAYGQAAADDAQDERLGLNDYD